MKEVEIPPNWSLHENECVNTEWHCIKESIGSACLNTLGWLTNIFYFPCLPAKGGLAHFNLDLPLHPISHPFSWTDLPTHHTPDGQRKWAVGRADVRVHVGTPPSMWPLPALSPSELLAPFTALLRWSSQLVVPFLTVHQIVSSLVKFW